MGCEMKSYLGRCRGLAKRSPEFANFAVSLHLGDVKKKQPQVWWFQPKPNSFAIVTMRTSQRGSRELGNVYFTSQIALTTSIVLSILASSGSGGVGRDDWPINWWLFGISLLFFPRGVKHIWNKTCSTNLVWVRIFFNWIFLNIICGIVAILAPVFDF